MVRTSDVTAAVEHLELTGRTVGVHVSLRSFGLVEGDAQAIVDGVLASSCTVVTPTYSRSIFEVAAPDEVGASGPGSQKATGPVFDTHSDAIDATVMGAVAAAVVRHPDRARGRHPICSFSAVGPRAEWLVETQSPSDAFAPMRRLAESNGWVVLMGVGLDRMSLLHVAEERLGRPRFLRWALGSDGEAFEVEVGGCSNGFGALAEHLRHLERVVTVGSSVWRAFPARDTLDTATATLRATPALTRCPDPSCQRCDVAIAGQTIRSRA